LAEIVAGMDFDPAVGNDEKLVARIAEPENRRSRSALPHLEPVRQGVPPAFIEQMEEPDVTQQGLDRIALHIHCFIVPLGPLSEFVHLHNEPAPKFLIALAESVIRT